MKYTCIYADPPWAERGGGKSKRGADRHYAVMPSQAIADLPVRDVVADDALLGLWATSNYLPDALRVADAWGFRYVTQRVWVKPSLGLGQWLRLRHEILLLCRRGRCPVPAPALRADSVLEAPKTTHSSKPPQARDWLAGIAPAGPRLELFARVAAPGWVAVGNGIDGQDVGDALRAIAVEQSRTCAAATTPPGGIVLDPYNGSGSTGCAAMLEGFQYIGIEREAEYIAISEKRIQARTKQPEQLTLFASLAASRAARTAGISLDLAALARRAVEEP